MKNYNIIIDGKTVSPKKHFNVINPATGEAFAQCALGDVAMVNLAVEAAKKAFVFWGQTSDAERVEKINQLVDLLNDNMSELAELLTLESGKPLNGLHGIGSTMEVHGAIGWAKAANSLTIPIDVIQEDNNAKIEVHRKPLGVVASITPWNWPLLIAIWHIIPALKTGNTVIIKPSSYTPVATLRFVELANTVLPPGVLNIVTGEAEVGNAMSSHAGISKVIFTGSSQTGKNIMSKASSNLKRLTLELGGNDAGIVLPNVDIKTIAPKLFTASFHNNGQTCACLKRLYVHESQYKELCTELVALAKNIKVGNGLEADSDLGPVQNNMQLAKVKELTADALANGAELLIGGVTGNAKGYFFPPTLIGNISDGSRLVDEEQFGPVLPIITYSDIDEVIARSNQNENGLGGSVWSSDLDLAAQIASKMETGSVWINSHGDLQPNVPFGGVKQSGFGVEFGHYGLEEYTSLQVIKINK